MAYAQTRSMNRELNEGLTDGKYYKVAAQRGNVVNDETARARMHLEPTYYGNQREAPIKVTPDVLYHI